MIGALVALISLEMSRRLISAGIVYATLSIVGATTTTPVVVTTSAPHNLAPARKYHGAVLNVGGMPEISGQMLEMTVTGPTTMSLATYAPSGTLAPTVGTGTYTSGGSILIAFPDGSILLGNRNVDMSTSRAAPRIVFVPTQQPAWNFEAIGGSVNPLQAPDALAAYTPEQVFSTQSRPIATEYQRFEVHVVGSASPPDPDFGDFDATQALYQTLYGVLFDLISPDRAKFLGARWDRLSLDQATQKWVGLLEIKQYVYDDALRFIPRGTVGVLTVNLAGAGSSDAVIIDLPPVA